MNDQQILLQKMQYIGRLFFRRLHDDLSETERIALEEWINQQDSMDRQFFEEMTDWKQIQTALQDLYRFDENSAFEDVQKKIHLESVLAISDSRQSRAFFVGQRYRYMIAGVFLILAVGASVLFMIKRKKDTNISSLSISQRFRNDVLPGGDKAVLILADGSRIPLDSVSNGELACQGNTTVIKLENGLLAYNIHSGGSQSVSYNTVSTPKGGKYQVHLPDGSKVWLNAASSLKFPTIFSGKERTVELAGEAYFQIAKNTAVPFKVFIIPDSGGREMSKDELMQIEVLGTEFNVMAYSNEGDFRATLINGAVKVTVGNEISTLKPGQQARITVGRNSSFSKIASDINIEEVIAWKNGLFEFQDASIQSIMRQVERWYDVNIVYNGKVDQQFIGKIPRQVKLSTLLKILESTGWVHFMIDGKKITIGP